MVLPEPVRKPQPTVGAAARKLGENRGKEGKKKDLGITSGSSRTPCALLRAIYPFPPLQCQGTILGFRHVLGKAQQESIGDALLPFLHANPRQIDEYFNKEIFH